MIHGQEQIRGFSDTPYTHVCTRRDQDTQVLPRACVVTLSAMLTQDGERRDDGGGLKRGGGRDETGRDWNRREGIGGWIELTLNPGTI